MIVVADTTPFSNFIQIDQLGLLKAVFGHIVIPPKVAEEVKRLKQAGYDLTEFSNTSWITVQTPQLRSLVAELAAELDAGESEALALAQEIQPAYVLVDESAARHKATVMNLRVIGSIGVLIQAKNTNLIPYVQPLLDAMIQQAGFWVKQDFYEQILTTLGEK